MLNCPVSPARSWSREQHAWAPHLLFQCFPLSLSCVHCCLVGIFTFHIPSNATNKLHFINSRKLSPEQTIQAQCCMSSQGENWTFQRTLFLLWPYFRLCCHWKETVALTTLHLARFRRGDAWVLSPMASLFLLAWHATRQRILQQFPNQVLK
jgi:hypothetical protein